MVQGPQGNTSMKTSSFRITEKSEFLITGSCASLQLYPKKNLFNFHMYLCNI